MYFKKKNKVPVFDVLYNHQYNMSHLTMNNFKKKKRMLIDLLSNEIDKKYLLTSKTIKIPYCLNTSVGF
jgi:hypothetical protein